MYSCPNVIGYSNPGKNEASPQRDRRLTIVMLSFNRRHEVLTNLARMQSLAGSPPVVLVDNGSCDGTVDAVREIFPEVHVIALPTNMGAAARNVGAAFANTSYVAFSDDDTAWAPEGPRKAADILDAHPRVAIVSAHVLVGTEARDDPACEPMRRSPLESNGLPGRSILGFMAGACVVRRSAFLAVGGYMPELFIGGEEAPLALDLISRGWKILYCPEVVTFHYPSPNRDAPTRRWLLARNAIWTAWMRLPVRDALHETGKHLMVLARQGQLLQGCWQTMRGMRRALKQRRIVPQHVQSMWRLVHEPVDEALQPTTLMHATPEQAAADFPGG